MLPSAVVEAVFTDTFFFVASCVMVSLRIEMAIRLSDLNSAMPSAYRHST